MDQLYFPVQRNSTAAEWPIPQPMTYKYVIASPLCKGAQLVEKSLAEFRVRRRESNTIRFLPRHVRGGKHFARSERRIVRYQRTTEAQSAAKLSRKSGKATFSTVSAPFARGHDMASVIARAARNASPDAPKPRALVNK